MNVTSIIPNLSQDLVRIHKVITRGLTVGMTRGTEFIRVGFPDRCVQQGFSDYIQSLGAVLGAHHLGEDEIAFPALKAKLPAAPYERLAADHKNIEAALTPMRNTISNLLGANSSESLGVVVTALRSIQTIWTPHIEVEETSFAATAIARVMSPEEQAQASVAMSKHAQEHAGPPFLVLPFVLFNLAGADRVEMAATFPSSVVEQLVPIEWKDRWAPMKPFLLD